MHQSENPQASPSLRANLNSPTLQAQIADTQFSSTLITYLKGKVRRTLIRRSSRRRVGLHRTGPIGQDFSGSCTVTSGNSLIQKGATTATKSEPFWPQRGAPGSIVK